MSSAKELFDKAVKDKKRIRIRIWVGNMRIFEGNFILGLEEEGKGIVTICWEDAYVANTNYIKIEDYMDILIL